MARRSRRLAVAVAGLTAVLGLALPAVSARAETAGYNPPSAEWWTTDWHMQQQVWPFTEGAGVTVAVVDSGVQASTPDLQGVVLRGTDMVGPSGDGNRDFGPSPGHGTFVAEMIAGQGVDGGPVGVAPQSKILPVHVVYPNSSSPNITIANGIKYAVNHGAGVINLSVALPYVAATSCDPVLQAAVSYAVTHNVVVVSGSGDINLTGQGPVEPASCAGVLTVGGIEPNLQLWKDSTRQPYVSVAAPADHILAGGANGQTGTASGTSFSGPLVAGAAALIRAKYPSMPWYQVDQRIINTTVGVKPIPNNDFGYGIMDIAKALDVSRFPVPASKPDPPYTRYLAWAKANGVTVPGAATSGSGGAGAAAGPSAGAKPAAKGSSTLIIILVVIVVAVLAALALILALVLRSRSGRGPRHPGGPGAYGAPGGYPPNAYAPPPGQVPPGQYPPPQDPQYPSGEPR